MCSERRIWLSSRATVVLPVPGLPVNTRWWLVSSVGMPRSSRSRWMRSRLVSRRTSALTCGQPDERVELGEQLLDRPLPAAAPAPRRGRRRRRCRRAPRPSPAGRAASRRRRRTRRAARCGSGRWRRSRPATARGRATRRRGPGGCRGRSSAPRAPCRRGRRRARGGRTACSAGAATPACRRASRSRAAAVDDTSTGGSRRVPMSSSHASSSAVEWRSSLSITAATRSPASTTTSRRWSRPGQLAQLGAHAVDERVDVLGQHPGHGPEGTERPDRVGRSSG